MARAVSELGHEADPMATESTLWMGVQTHGTKRVGRKYRHGKRVITPGRAEDANVIATVTTKPPWNIELRF